MRKLNHSRSASGARLKINELLGYLDTNRRRSLPLSPPKTWQPNWESLMADELSKQAQMFHQKLDLKEAELQQIVRQKEGLSQNCQEMAKQMETLAQESAQKLRNHERETTIGLKKLKEKMEADEMASRNKWEKHKTKGMREQLIKSFQPQIEAVLKDQKALRVTVETQLKQEFEAQKLDLERSFEGRLEEAHQKWEVVSQKLAEEALIHRTQRLDSKIQELETLVAHRRQELDDQKIELKTARDQQVVEQTRYQQELHLRQVKEAELKDLQKDWMTHLKGAHQDYQLKLSHNQEALEKQSQLVCEEYAKRYEATWEAHCQELRQKIEAEFQESLDEVLTKLAQECHQKKERSKERGYQQASQIREDLKEKEALWQLRNQEWAAQKEAQTLEIANLQQALAQLEKVQSKTSGENQSLRRELASETAAGKQTAEDFQEFRQVSFRREEEIRQEVQGQLETSQKETRKLAQELGRLQAHHEHELEDLRKQEETRLNQVDLKVKALIQEKNQELDENLRKIRDLERQTEEFARISKYIK